MRRLIAIAGVALLAGCGGGGTQSGLAVHVDTNPFRVTVVENGKTIVTEDKGARLRYQLISTGDQHSLTKVLKQRGDVYTVATDEAGRFASVTVQQTATGARIDLQLHPTTDVQQVYDAFDTSSHDHFLGGGENRDGVDLRGRILPVKVSDVCSSAPVPFFASSAGWGLRLATQNVAALAFPGSAGGGGCQFGSEPQCAFPPLSDRAEVCVRGANLTEDIYTGTSPQRLPRTSTTPASPSCPRPASLR